MSDDYARNYVNRFRLLLTPFKPSASDRNVGFLPVDNSIGHPCPNFRANLIAELKNSVTYAFRERLSRAEINGARVNYGAIRKFVNVTDTGYLMM